MLSLGQSSAILLTGRKNRERTSVFKFHLKHKFSTPGSSREGLISRDCGLRRRRSFQCGGFTKCSGSTKCELLFQRRNAAKTLTLKFKKLTCNENRTTEGGEFEIRMAYLRTEPPKVVSLKLVKLT